MASTLIKPFSTGTVGIRSGSAWDEPVIDPRYLSDKRDQKVRVMTRSLSVYCRIPRGRITDRTDLTHAPRRSS